MEKEMKPVREVGKKKGLIILSAAGFIILAGFLWYSISSDKISNMNSFNVVFKANTNSSNTAGNSTNTVIVNENINVDSSANENANVNLPTNSNTNVPVNESTVNMNTAIGGSSDVSVIDTSNWETYENKQLGFSFKYPSSFGYVSSTLEVGDTGRIFRGTFSNTANIVIGGASSDYTFPSEAGFTHTYGYKSVVDGYSMLLPVTDPSLREKSVNLIKKITAVNTNGILVKTDFFEVEQTGAIFNLNHDTITGMALLKKDTETLPLDQFEAILKTFTLLTPKENTTAVINEIDTSDWNVYENSLRKFTIKYPNNWVIDEYQEESVGFRPKCCTYHEPSTIDYEVFPVHIMYASYFESLQNILKSVRPGLYTPYELGNVTGYGNYEDYDDIEQIYAPVPGNRTVYIQGMYYVVTEDAGLEFTKNDFRNIYLAMLKTFEITEEL
ncbi:MAG: hypothetical protein WCT33_04120 [Patescibacteria group bacterium]